MIATLISGDMGKKKGGFQKHAAATMAASIAGNVNLHRTAAAAAPAISDVLSQQGGGGAVLQPSPAAAAGLSSRQGWGAALQPSTGGTAARVVPLGGDRVDVRHCSQLQSLLRGVQANTALIVPVEQEVVTLCRCDPVGTGSPYKSSGSGPDHAWRSPEHNPQRRRTDDGQGERARERACMPMRMVGDGEVHHVLCICRSPSPYPLSRPCQVVEHSHSRQPTESW